MPGKQWNDALQKKMSENRSLLINFDLMTKDRDKLRDCLRQIAAWVNWTEAASGTLPMPLDMVKQMKTVLKDTE